MESSARLFRIYPVPDIFRRDAAHEAGDQPAVGEAVDHRVFFGDANRMIAQRQDITEHADLDLLGFLAERGRDQIRRGHRAVGAVMVLVENHTVEPQLFAIGHLLQVLIVIGHAFGRIEETTRHRRARRFFGHVGIGEKIEVIKLHEQPRARLASDERHLALAVEAPDAAVAAALDEAARGAFARGAIESAAALGEQALRFTDEAQLDALQRRRLAAAGYDRSSV